MFKWRNSCDPEYNKKIIQKDGKLFLNINGRLQEIQKGLKIKKLVGKRLYPTTTYYDKGDDFEHKLQNHEPYKPGTRYFIEFSKDHPRYSMKRSKDFKYYRTKGDIVTEEVTE